VCANAKPATSLAEAVVAVAKVNVSALLVKAKATVNPVRRRARAVHRAATMTAVHATAKAAMAQAMEVATVEANNGPHVTHQATPPARAVTVPLEAHVKTVAHAKTAQNANRAPTPTWAACASASHA
jgi:hypothetical protein